MSKHSRLTSRALLLIPIRSCPSRGFIESPDLSKYGHQTLVPGRVVLTRSQFGMGVRSQLKEVQVTLGITGTKGTSHGASLMTSCCLMVPPWHILCPFQNIRTSLEVMDRRFPCQPLSTAPSCIHLVWSLSHLQPRECLFRLWMRTG